MTIRTWLIPLLAIGLMAYTHFDSDNLKTQTPSTMHNLISIYEIPATDINRAVNFYQSLLDLQIEVIDMQGVKMGLLPSENQAASGVITVGEGYQPSSTGVVIYFNAGDDLQNLLDKVEQSGGSIVVPKTFIDEENGYFAHILDSEGNKVGLHSLK